MELPPLSSLLGALGIPMVLNGLLCMYAKVINRGDITKIPMRLFRVVIRFRVN
jgi:hypothetical protein